MTNCIRTMDVCKVLSEVLLAFLVLTTDVCVRGDHDLSAGGYRRVCYYTNWSQYREGRGKFTPANITTPGLCTHIIYAFANLRGNQLQLREWNDAAMIKSMNAIKMKTNGLKTLIAVGGWNAGTAGFSAMAATAQNRKQFADSAVKLIREHGFDGLDLDWEYPNKWGHKPQDKANYALLVKELKAAFIRESVSSRRPRLLLSAAVPAGVPQIDRGYDVKSLSRDLDFINLMTYDLHGSWEKRTGENAPLYARSGETATQKRLNVVYAANYWVQNGAPKSKLNIGMASYGRSFTLTDPSNHSIGAPASGPGPAGPVTGERGFMAYYEICRLGAEGGKRKWDYQQKVPYLVKDNVWVGYDDIISLYFKVQWLVAGGYGGAMLWALDLDDFGGVCTSSYGRKFPLLATISSLLLRAERRSGSRRPTSRHSRHDNVKSRDTVDQKATSAMKIGFGCRGRLNGYYPDPASCRGYYTCSWGVATHHNCPDKLWFNEQLRVCDWTTGSPCQGL